MLVFRKMFIIDYKLPYPSGAATGVLINSEWDTDGGGALQPPSITVRAGRACFLMQQVPRSKAYNIVPLLECCIVWHSGFFTTKGESTAKAQISALLK